jgi:lipoyl(octanoyl) transferase
MALLELLIVDLGRMAYGPALELQRAVARERFEGRLEQDVLLLVEHSPVVTLGRASREEHVLATRDVLAARGVELFEVERGGDVTFHGPGQLVGYPILDLRHHQRDLHWYLRQVEESLIRGLASCGLPCTRNPGYTGVWTEGLRRMSPHRSLSLQRAAGGSVDGSPDPPQSRPLRKIASIGVHAREWVTWHGFALNLTTDLRYFDLIVPCGISGVTMTTVERELGPTYPGVRTVTDAILDSFARVFQRVPTVRPASWLESAGIAPTFRPRAGTVRTS